MRVPIVWNPHGFHLIDALSKGQRFNATYYLNIILQPLLDGRSGGPGAGLIIQTDNARGHTAQKTLKLFSGKSPWNRARSTRVMELGTS
jgi:hypothetical protein